MIKDAKNLKESGLKDLMAVYTDYFRNDCECNVNRPLKNLEQKLLATRYAKECIRRIKIGETTCIVECDELEKITGFISGYADGAEGFLTHFWLENEAPMEDTQRKLKLFGAFLDSLRAQMVQSVVAYATRYENKFLDTLGTLGFELGSEKDEWIYDGESGAKHL